MDEEGQTGIALLKDLVARHAHLGAIDELAALTGARELHQVADCCKYGGGGTVYQLAADMKTLLVLGHFSGLLSDAQTLWQVLSQELCRSRGDAGRALGRIPAVCWADHSNVVRTASKAEAEEKHLH